MVKFLSQKSSFTLPQNLQGDLDFYKATTEELLKYYNEIFEENETETENTNQTANNNQGLYLNKTKSSIQLESVPEKLFFLLEEIIKESSFDKIQRNVIGATLAGKLEGHTTKSLNCEIIKENTKLKYITFRLNDQYRLVVTQRDGKIIYMIAKHYKGVQGIKN